MEPSRSGSSSQLIHAWWPAVGWVLVIVVLTTIPLPSVRGLSGSPVDKLVHFGLYFGLGWALGRAARLSGIDRPVGLLGVLAGGIAFAAADELLQGWIPRRAPQMSDWLADVAGLVTAYLAYLSAWKGRWKKDDRRA